LTTHQTLSICNPAKAEAGKRYINRLNQHCSRRRKPDLHSVGGRRREAQTTLLRPLAPPPIPPENFIEVLEKWGHTWIWKEMKITNACGKGLRLSSPDDFIWICHAIAERTLVCVTDGSYIKQLCPLLCSAAVILECSQGRGRLILSFPKRSKNANAYRGELLGLMCIHLLLLSFNLSWPGLKGSVDIYSDCLGALNKVKNLPPHRIPSKYKHSDILKTIMSNCSDLSFN
jgi:hypothetical protein